MAMAAAAAALLLNGGGARWKEEYRSGTNNGLGREMGAHVGSWRLLLGHVRNPTSEVWFAMGPPGLIH